MAPRSKHSHLHPQIPQWLGTAHRNLPRSSLGNRHRALARRGEFCAPDHPLFLSPFLSLLQRDLHSLQLISLASACGTRGTQGEQSHQALLSLCCCSFPPFLAPLTPFLPLQLSSANGYPYRNSSLKRGQAADQTQAVDAFKQNVTQHVNR